MATTELTVPAGGRQLVGPTGRGLELRSLDDLKRFALMISKSDLVPRQFQDRPANVLLAVEHGAELGLSPIQSLQSICVISGRPAIFGDAALALVRASGLCESITEAIEGAGDERAATCTTHRVGEQAAVVRMFSVADAKRAKLWGKTGPWSTYPDRMLQLRARAFALRDAYPDVLCGVGVVEEQRDIPQPSATAVASEPAVVETVTIETAPPTTSDPTTTLMVDSGNGSPEARDADLCRESQRARIRELFKQLGAPATVARAAIERRGVARLVELSEGQAGGLIRNLEERLLRDVPF
jgi:hypothetical protein